jgi:hypothetical protein
MLVAWVKYECGCCEGIWIDDKSKCIAHDKPVIETSNIVDLKPPFENKTTNDFKESKCCANCEHADRGVCEFAGEISTCFICNHYLAKGESDGRNQS